MPTTKFSQFTQALASELKVDLLELEKYFVVGHTEEVGAENNVKLPLLDLMESLGDGKYLSSESSTTPMPQSIGGLGAGTLASALKQMTVSQVLDIMLFPIVQPTISSPSFVINSFAQSGLQEIGSTLSVNLTTTFNPGQITNGTGSAGPNVIGEISVYEFTGPGIAGVTSQGSGDAGAGTLTAMLDVVSGVQRWTVSAYHANGLGGYTDSKGNPSSIFDGQRASAVLTANSATVTGIYPILYGANADNLLVSGQYAGLTKLVQQKGNKSLTLTASNQYAYFAFPSTYGELQEIRDGNGFNVISAFQKVNITVSSTGLVSNWSTSYTIYRTNSPTTINSQTYQFIWA